MLQQGAANSLRLMGWVNSTLQHLQQQCCTHVQDLNTPQSVTPAVSTRPWCTALCAPSNTLCLLSINTFCIETPDNNTS